MTHSHTRLLVCVALIVLTTAAFWQINSNDFINYDDDLYIYQNDHIKDGLNRQSFLWAFTTTSNNNWHPLTWLSYMLDYQFSGLSPHGYHLTNLLLHLANVILLFLVFNRMTGALWPSAMVAALFALHPLHVQSVAWVAERKDVLSACFWFLTMWAYVRYTKRPVLTNYFLILFFFVLGLLSKPMLVTLPFVLLLLDYWPLARWPLTPQVAKNLATGKKAFPPISPLRSGVLLVLEKVPLLFLTALSCLVTLYAQQMAIKPLIKFPLWSRMANSLVAYGRYLGKTVWPSQLAVFYPYPGKGLPWWQVGGAVLILLSISLLVIRQARRRPYLPVGWFWFLGTLVPVIGLVQVGEQALADRYTYIPLIGLFIIGVWGTLDLSASWRHRRLFLTTMAGIIISFATLLTWQQVAYWRNSISLFQQAIRVTSGNYLAFIGLGVAYHDTGRVNEAIEMYNKAIVINPYSEYAYTNLGIAYEQEGRPDEAVEAYRKAIKVTPSYRKPYKKLVSFYEKQGNTGEAIKVLQLAIENNPDFIEAYNKLALLLLNNGKLDEAIALFRKAIQVQPDFSVAYYNLGLVYVHLNKNDEAISMFRKALQIKPDLSEARDLLEKLTPR